MNISYFAIVKVVLIGLLCIFLILFLVFGSWVLWERNRDALAGIDFYSGKVELSHAIPYNLSFEDLSDRTYRHITLTTVYLGNI